MNRQDKIAMGILYRAREPLTTHAIVELSQNKLNYDLLHPTLQRLERRKHVVSVPGESNGFQLIRRLYKLTELGRETWNVHRATHGV